GKGHRTSRSPNRRRRTKPFHDERGLSSDADHAPLRGYDRHRMPRPHGHELSNSSLRRLCPSSVLHGLGHRYRHARDIPVPPASASPAPVALPTHLVAPEDAGAHV